MKRFDTGIVVGKFAPLHKGHEWLIDTARSQCRQVVVVSYCLPEFAGCEAERRRRWLGTRFPDITVIVVSQSDIDEWMAQGHWQLSMPHNNADAERHRQFTAQLLQRHGIELVDAVFSSEEYGQGFADSLTTHYRQHLKRPHEVAAICVDPARVQVPISATRLRAGLHAHRQFLSACVYQDFVSRVCFIGGESSGKTTLANTLADRLQTVWVPEFGRELWLARQGALAWDDYLTIAETQIRHEEDAISQANAWLPCDTSPLTTLLYCLDQFGRAPDALWQLARRPYARVFLCAPDFEFVQDDTRRGPAYRAHQHQRYLTLLDQLEIPFTLLSGSLEARIRETGLLNSSP